MHIATLFNVKSSNGSILEPYLKKILNVPQKGREGLRTTGLRDIDTALLGGAGRGGTEQCHQISQEGGPERVCRSIT
jgi:hypothetical protein